MKLAKTRYFRFVCATFKNRFVSIERFYRDRYALRVCSNNRLVNLKTLAENLYWKVPHKNVSNSVAFDFILKLITNISNHIVFDKKKYKNRQN